MYANPQATPARNAMSQSSTPTPPPTPENAEAARNVWLAGLGALAQAQARGTELFDSLVQAGLNQQAKAREMAETELSKAAQQLAVMTGATPMAPWDRLSGIFEGRVARALAHIGMPAPDAVQGLLDRIEQLEARVAALESGTAPATPSVPAKATAARRARTKGGSAPT